MANNNFIGRKDELKRLHAAYVEASSGKGKLVLIEGDAGIGKSGLAREFIRQIEHDSKVIIGISECNDKENLNAYAPFKDILVELNSKAFDSTGKLSKGDRLKKAKQFISDSGSSWIGLIPIVGDFIETGIDTYRSYQNTYNNKPKSNIESENDIYRIFENEFRRLAKDKTIVIFIDDLQWADTSSLNLLFALGKIIRANPFKILLIGSYRPSEIKAKINKISETGETINIRHPFADKLNELQNYTKKENHILENNNWFIEIVMKPLSHEEIYELINTRFLNNQFNPELFENINNLTDGQPLYIVEILNYLLRNSIIENNNGIYTAKDVKLDELPPSVNAIITEKIERLNEKLKKVLSYASVNGEEFAVQVVEKILDVDELDLLGYLQELNNVHGLLVPEDPTHVKDVLMELYSFSQTLVHKFIYENMDNAMRRALHRRIAKIFEELYGDAIETNKAIKDSYNLHKQIGQGLIDAVNFQMIKTDSNETDKAIPKADVFIAAAITEIQNAKDNYDQFAMNECYDFIDKALAFLSKVDDSNTDKLLQEFKALLLRNKAKQWQGHYQEAFDTGVKLNSIATQLSNNYYIAQVNLALGTSKADLGYNTYALEYLEKAIEFFEITADYNSLSKAYTQAGKIKYAMSAYNDAIALYEKAILLSNKIEDKNIKGDILLRIGSCYSSMWEEDTKVMSYFNQALTIFKENNYRYGIGNAYNKIGLMYRSQVNYDKAQDFIENALSIARKQNDRVNISNRLSNIGLIHESKNNYAKAIDFYKKSLAIDIQLDDKPMIAKSMSNIGGVYAKNRNNETALDYLNKSLQIIKSIDDKKELANSYFVLAQAFENMNNNDSTIKYYLKSIEIDTSINNKPSLALSNWILGSFYKRIKKLELAYKHLKTALGFATETGNREYIAAINHELGYITNSNSRYSKAIEYYKKSLDYFLKVNNKLKQSDVGEDIAESYLNLKQYDKAISFFKGAICIAEDLNNKTELSRLYSRLSLALYYAQHYKESIIYLKNAIPINEELNKQEDLAGNYIDIGDSLHMLEDYNEAIINYQVSLKMRIKIFGKEHKNVAKTYVNIGNSYYYDKQYNLAVKNYRNAYNIRIKNVSRITKEADVSRFLLAKACYFADIDDEARELLSDCINYRKTTYGEKSDEFNEAMDLLGTVLNYLNKSSNPGNAAPN